MAVQAKQLGFIPSEQINVADYNRLLSKSDMGVYAYSWYMNIVSSKWGIVTNHNQKVFIPIAFKLRPGYKNMYQPFFCMFTVPVNINEEDLVNFLEVLQHNFTHVELHLPFKYKGPLPAGMEATERIRQEVKIDSYTRIKKNYSDNAIRSIKKADKAELELKYDIEPETVVKEFSQNKGADLGDIKPDDLKRLNQLITTAIKNKAGFTVGCYSGDELLASAFFLTHDNRLIYLKGSVNDAGKKQGAMYFIFDSVIKEMGNNFLILDFGGSNVKSVADFYHRLGGKDVTYTRIQSKPRGMTKLVSTLKKLRRRK